MKPRAGERIAKGRNEMLPKMEGLLVPSLEEWFRRFRWQYTPFHVYTAELGVC